MKKTLFIKNAVILTVSAMILRFAGIIFKVWLARLIGSEGIGLYQLIFSVYVLASTFAQSGISTAVTRLTAEELALGQKGSVVKILRRSIELTLILSAVTIGVLFCFAKPIAVFVLSDERAVLAIKVLPLSLPFMGMCSCFRGYFIARRNATPSSVSAIIEQTVRIAAVFLLAGRFQSKGLGVMCAAVIFGDAVSEFAGCLVMFLIYKNDKRRLEKLKGRSRPPYGIVKKITEISLPITSGRYLNSLLRTAENILVPKNLAKYTFATSNALSQFGMIKGMALPILFFPSTVLNAVSTLLIPEMSEAAALKRKMVVKCAVYDVLKLTALVSFIFAAIFYVSGEEIGVLIYGDISVGYLLKVLSPIVPFMYLDSVSDGILKGLDQQRFTFKTAISDSAIRIILILLLLPVMGLKGFIIIMYFSNALTCFLNVGRLIKISEAKFKIMEDVLFPLLFSLALCIFFDMLIGRIGVKTELVYIILICGASLPIYTVFLFLSGIAPKRI